MQTPSALLSGGGSYPVPPKPQQLPGTGVAGQATAQMPMNQPAQQQHQQQQQQQQQHQQQFQRPPQQQSAQPSLQQLGNGQGQGNAHTHPPQVQAMQSPTSAHPLPSQHPSYSHQSPTTGPLSANSPVNGLASQQAQSPSNGNPAASLSNVGQDVKKWAKKMWKSPAFQQTTTAIGGALLAESMGGDGVSGAMAASHIYNNSQAQQQGRPPGQQQGQLQGQQPLRPQRPPHVHAQTAPSQIQRPPGPHPSIQPAHQPASNVQPGGVQIPGRPPYAVQNTSMQGAPMQMQPRPPAQAPMANPPFQGQQGQYAVNQPPPQAQGQYLASQPVLYSPPPDQTVINQQQTINQTFTMNTESNDVNTVNGSMAAYSQQSAVIQNNQVIVDNSGAYDTCFAQQPAAAAAAATPVASNDVNITNINIEANANNAQYMYNDSSATYYDNSMATTTTATDVVGVSNTTAVTDYNTTASTEYSAVAVDYNNVTTTNVDYQMETMYTAADDVSTLYSTESVDASATVESDGWAAVASVTVDYSGGDWGEGWSTF
ncbi:hypothetical protein PG988_013949 [Apiospora saccharicola]